MTYFIKTPKEYEFLTTRVLVEYRGPDNDEGSSVTPHKNARNMAQPYYRVKPSVLANVKENLTNRMPPNEVYSKNLNPENPLDGLRNHKQVYNLKHKLTSTKSGNIADDYLQIIRDLMNGHEFVQRLLFSSGQKLPIIAAWKPWQIDMIKNVCSADRAKISPLGFDATFNLGKNMILMLQPFTFGKYVFAA